MRASASCGARDEAAVKFGVLSMVSREASLRAAWEVVVVVVVAVLSTWDSSSLFHFLQKLVCR
jgi:hypothetical protein